MQNNNENTPLTPEEELIYSDAEEIINEYLELKAKGYEFPYVKDVKKAANGKEIPSRNMEIANIILQQLGGAGRLKMMTGAYNFIAIENGLSFRIKNPKANYVNITLNGSDYYDVKISRIRGVDVKPVYSQENVPVENLRKEIEKGTGMYLSLKDGGEADKKYELGDKYRPDFDYEGMFNKVLETNTEWGVKDLEKLEASLTDVNYHTQSRLLGRVITDLNNGDKILAAYSLLALHKSMQDEINDQELTEGDDGNAGNVEMKYGGPASDNIYVAEPNIFYLDEKGYPGYTYKGQDWNGFAVPYFTESVAREIATDMDGTKIYGNKIIDKGWAFPDYEGAPLADHSVFNGQIIQTTEGEKEVFPIGAYKWSWTTDQMKNGGPVATDLESTVSEIAYATGLRKIAILDYINENSLSEDDVLKLRNLINKKKITAMDFTVAVAGKKDNHTSKEVVKLIKSDSVSKKENGGPINTTEGVYIDTNKNKFVLIDTRTNALWANEYFKTPGEAEGFARQNNLNVIENPHKMGNGGPVEINKELSDFDVSNLDEFERRQYDHHIQSMSKEEALQVLINSVDEDYSQLSPELAEIAERQDQPEKKNEIHLAGSDNISEELQNFDLSLLNDFETRIYDWFIISRLTKEEALRLLIFKFKEEGNNLSSELESISNRQGSINNTKHLNGGLIGNDTFRKIDDSFYVWDYNPIALYSLYIDPEPCELKYLIYHPLLFERYEGIGKIKVLFFNGPENKAEVEMPKTLNLVNNLDKCIIKITLNFKYYEKHKREFKTIDSNEPDLAKESILLHELQHVLQALHNRSTGISYARACEEADARINTLRANEKAKCITTEDQLHLDFYNTLTKKSLYDYFYYSNDGEVEARNVVRLWLKSKGVKYVDPLTEYFGIILPSDK